MINLKLPWPPTVNTYYTIARNRKILSKRGREYKKTTLEVGPELTGRLEVRIDAYPPDRRKRDLDNIVKPILDLLTDNKVWTDDELIDILTIRRKEIKKPGEVRVYIEEIEDE